LQRDRQIDRLANRLTDGVVTKISSHTDEKAGELRVNEMDRHTSKLTGR
jgi:hypothetical protein